MSISYKTVISQISFLWRGFILLFYIGSVNMIHDYQFLLRIIANELVPVFIPIFLITGPSIVFLSFLYWFNRINKLTFISRFVRVIFLMLFIIFSNSVIQIEFLIFVNIRSVNNRAGSRCSANTKKWQILTNHILHLAAKRSHRIHHSHLSIILHNWSYLLFFNKVFPEKSGNHEGSQ